MKKYLKLKSLTVREVPQELDLRIIAAARLRQGSGQARRKFLRWTISAAAAAAGVFIAIGICFSQVDTGFNPKLTQEEYARLMADKAYLEDVMKKGAEEAAYHARKTVSKVKRKLGFVI